MISTAMTTLLIFILLSMPVLLLDIGYLDFGVGFANCYRVALNVFVVHFFGGLEEVVSVAETDKTVALGLGCTLVTNDAGLLDRWPARESLEKGVVSGLACKITDKES